MKRLINSPGVKLIYPILLICSLFYIGCSETPLLPTESNKMLDETSLKSDKALMNKKILFSSERDGNREIYVMNADGSEQSKMIHYSINE